MTDSQVPSVPQERPLFTGRFVVPEGYPKAASGAFTRFQLTRPFVWIPLVVVLLAIGLASWQVVVTGTRVGTTTIAFPIIVIVLVVFSMVSRSRALTKQLSVNGRAGGVYEVTLTDSTITTVTPNASSTLRYDYYEALNEQGDFIFLKVRGARLRSIVPRQLFSDDAFAYLRSRISR